MFDQITSNVVFDNNTLNIFTDASMKTLPSGEQIGCSGCVAVHGKLKDSNIDSEYRIIRNSTNNNSEIKAIRLGVEYALRYKNKYDIIRLFSDSQISIFGIRERIFKWLWNNGKYYCTTGEVKNQDVMIEIINTIINNDLRIEFYHQKGHVKYDRDTLLNALHVFKVSNNIRQDISLDFIKDISILNNMVDVGSRNRFNDLHYPLDKNLYIEPLIFNNSSFKLDKDKYLNLIHY